MRKLIGPATAAVAVAFALLADNAALAQSRFNGLSGMSWADASNWTPAAVPGIGSNVVIGTTNAAVGVGGSPRTVTIAAGDACSAASLTLAEYDGNSGTLNMDGGTLALAAAGNITVAGKTSSTGVLNQTGGTLGGTASAVTIGGGTNLGDRYGLVTLTNATFGGTTAVSVWTNGFVELAGTGSVFRCNTFLCNGGTVTNHVRLLSGGIDVTNTAGTALVITNGGLIHLSFEENPPVATNLWALRWAGNNHSNDMQSLLDRNALTWSTWVGAKVRIFTNATHTWVGYDATIPHGLMFVVQ